MVILSVAYIDLGFDVWVTKRIRFKGVDTWEKRTRNKQEKILDILEKIYDRTFGEERR